MTSQVDQLKESFRAVLGNPSSVQRIALRAQREITAGRKEIYDPSNPWVQLMEISATMSSALNSRFTEGMRALYPSLARSYDDLYHHMSDKDYIGRFALPAPAPYNLMFDRNELVSRLVLDSSTGYRKIIIPQESQFTAGGMVFSNPYPIEIRQSQHGELSAVWLVGPSGSPVATVPSNIIETRTTTDGQREFFLLRFGCWQYEIQTTTSELSPSGSLSFLASFVDQFYYARVYVTTDATATGATEWREILTTHSGLTYDPNEITAVLKVYDNQLEVSIPIVYMNRFPELGGSIRIDTYGTRGAVAIDLGNLESRAFGFTWGRPTSSQSLYSAPLSQLETITVWSGASINGGRDGLTFEQQRRRVIFNNLGPRQQPITPDQIQDALEDEGFTIVKGVDNLTDRVFLATRQLPEPMNDRLITAAGLSVQSAILSMDQLATLGSVVDNGDSMTILPRSVFQNRAGRLSLLPWSQVQGIQALPPDQRASAVTAGNFYYTPWYYVLTTTETDFTAKAYHLDNPQAQDLSFISESPTTMMSCSITGYELVQNDDGSGYYLQVTTRENEAVQQLQDDRIFAQLSFVPMLERTPAFQNGQLMGVTEDGAGRIWRFDLSTSWRVTRLNGLELTQFSMFNQAPDTFPSPLEAPYTITFSTSEAMPVTWEESATDDLLGRFLLPNRIAAISAMQLTVRYGYALEDLWTQARTLPGQKVYQTYEFDIQKRYDRDIYSPITLDPSGKPVMTLEHARGDLMFNEDGSPVWEHRIGDVIYDGDGEPIVISPRKMLQMVDFMLVDGAYYFATDPIISPNAREPSDAVPYRIELRELLVDWIINAIGGLRASLLDKTRIYFYPRATTGPVEVMYGDGLTTELSAQQSLTATIHVDDKVMRQASLMEAITRQTIQVVGESLTKQAVAISDIIVLLRRTYGDDVKDVRLQGLGGQQNYPMVTIINQQDRLSLRKRLVARPDGILGVEEDLTMVPVRHQLTDQH